MRQIQVSLPDKVADQAQAALDQGWFNNLDDLVRTALAAFFENNSKLVLESQQLDDVNWARRKLAG